MLGTISVFAYRQRETEKNLCRGGRSQEHSEYWLLASSPASKVQSSNTHTVQQIHIRWQQYTQDNYNNAHSQTNSNYTQDNLQYTKDNYNNTHGQTNNNYTQENYNNTHSQTNNNYTQENLKLGTINICIYI
jgi:hypothetical protein